MEINAEETLSEDGKTWTVVMMLPKQLLLNVEWEMMVHDEVLRRAHKRGLIPIGEILITTEEVPPPDTSKLGVSEGVRLSIDSWEEWKRQHRSQSVDRPNLDLFKCTGEVVIGSSLDMSLEDVTTPSEVPPEQSLEELLESGGDWDVSELDADN